METNMAEMVFIRCRQEVAGRNLTVAAPLLVGDRSCWALVGVWGTTGFSLSPLGLIGRIKKAWTSVHASVSFGWCFDG